MKIGRVFSTATVYGRGAAAASPTFEAVIAPEAVTRALEGPVSDGSASPARGRRLPGRWELAAVVLIVAAASLFRLLFLGSIPHGISQDEAIVGLEGERILHTGWIGPYSPLGAGQPAGVLYLAAASIAALGRSLIALRLVVAVAGILTVVGLYGLTRRSFGFFAASVAAVLLATSSWAIHFSRFAIPVGVWQLVGVLVAGSLFEALKRDSMVWWAAAGASAAAGVYVYDANNVFLLVVALFVAYVMVARRRALTPILTGVAVMAIAFVVVAFPMIRWMNGNLNSYLGHARYNSIFNQPEWTALHGHAAKAHFLAKRYVQYWDRLCCHPYPDGPDGTGTAALTPPPFLILVGCGMLLGLWRRRGPPVILGIAVVVAMPVASVVSDGGLARRAYVILPFLAMFAGFAVAELVAIASSLKRWLRIPVAGALILSVGFLAYHGVTDYFDKFHGSEAERWTFEGPLNDTALFIKNLPPNRHVYFYSVGTVTHEVVRFLAPNADAEDRAGQFGGQFSYAIANDGKVPVFIFMDAFEQDLNQVQRLYPGGTTFVGGPPSRPSFIAYTAPATARSTGP